MKFLYLDSCAAIKLFKDEVESEALEEWLVKQSPDRQITSQLSRTEVRRGLHACGAHPDAHLRADQWLQRCSHVTLTSAVYDKAGQLSPGTALRSLDAIHVAAALELGSALAHFVTYDKRLAALAAQSGLPVVAPS